MKYQVMPDLTPIEYEALKADIEESGVKVPIEIDETGELLDGHHRRRAWEELKAEGVDLPDYPRIIRTGMTEREKRNHARRLNVLRRQLTDEQRIEQMRAMRADGMTYQKIADAVGVSVGTVHNAASDVELFKNEKLPGADGKSRPATYTKRAQATIFVSDDKEHGRVKDALAKINAPVSGNFTPGGLQREARKQMHQSKVAPPKLEGVYDVILVDPPWQYNNSGFDNSAESQYPTMSTGELKALDVPSMSHNGTVLFMWATNPLLVEAMDLMKAWGFEYKQNMAWVKDKGRGFGWWLRSKHELILIGVRSETPQPAARPDSCFEADRGNVHSRKPERSYEIIEAMYPEARKIELFARVARAGWDAWGNENV